mmetsp:Transcript_30980/g.38257  ORF Transcript_30980/g.38257 Transcript_30980/m.38257 type:complete len:320 (+) Transcript_30980:91-1050(+)
MANNNLLILGDLARPKLVSFARVDVQNFLDKHQEHLQKCKSARMPNNQYKREELLTEYLNIDQKRQVAKRLIKDLSDLTHEDVESFLNESLNAQQTVEADPVKLLKGKVFLKYGKDIRDTVINLEMFIDKKLKSANVPLSKVSLTSVQGKINLFKILRNTLPKELRVELQQFMLDNTNPNSQLTLTKDPDYEMVLEKYTSLVSEWFKSFRFRPQIEPKKGAIMRVELEEEDDEKLSKPKFDQKSQRQRWNADNMVNDLSKRQKRALIKALNVRPTKRTSIECWKCKKNHHLKQCPEFQDEEARKLFYKDRLSKMKKATQ